MVAIRTIVRPQAVLPTRDFARNPAGPRGLAQRHGIDIAKLLTDYRADRKRTARRWQLAATLLCAAAVGTFWHSTHLDTANTLTGIFATKQGEHRCAILPDMTQVCLNTQSAVRYTFVHTARTVELLQGEASFVVHKDRRPLDVRVGRLLVRDISTEFNVYRRSDSTIVTVLEGGVKVAAEPEPDWKTAPEFHRLQQVEFDEATLTLRIRPALTESGLSQVTAWKRGRIDLTGTSLYQALNEFSRYQPINRFIIQDRALRQFKVGGEIDATHLTDFLDSLRALYGIQYSLTKNSDGQVVVTLSRPNPDLRRRAPQTHHGANG